MNRIYASLPDTIFDVMSGLARELGAINLGQGFPEDDGPLDLREAAARALIECSNQYPPMRGLPETREAVAAHYNTHQNLDLDWLTEVTVTSGATEAIAAALFGVINPGDEVVLIEPAYDAYAPLVARAGGIVRYVRLEPPDWRVTEDALKAAFSDKTRAVVLNTPNNPAGALMNEHDLELIAKYCVAHDAIAISDEVWEHVVFDGDRHISMLAAPGMRARTIKIGSAGKMFQMTGWKIGFLCATPELSSVLVKAHQFLTYATPPNLQRAVAVGLQKPLSFFLESRTALQRARDRLTAALTHEGFVVLPSKGTYFLNIDLAASGIDLSDREFALRAVKEASVATIPLSAFYGSAPKTQLARLCFAKRDETLDRGVEALAKARRLMA
ncbi:MAG: aminotransferase [Caulobacterales bacterium]